MISSRITLVNNKVRSDIKTSAKNVNNDSSVKNETSVKNVNNDSRKKMNMEKHKI